MTSQYDIPDPNTGLYHHQSQQPEPFQSQSQSQSQPFEPFESFDDDNVDPQFKDTASQAIYESSLLSQTTNTNSAAVNKGTRAPPVLWTKAMELHLMNEWKRRIEINEHTDQNLKPAGRAHLVKQLPAMAKDRGMPGASVSFEHLLAFVTLPQRS
ncbi:unnamed protein product [Zymoseptoria tritici ST99CH_3D1]|uniref:Uncharacterized protein n=2 Tax=Zymoseptoria tritici TaxID=1047171 RepID=F9XSD3_ZYMTI|nr:uncharacterized protein MYCGRDRAFT_98123 [Zymoseptoria tritici IPO323]EGP81851.1 hypothetical protein MYCGRDRAFT_98123 [Zymoseptoria tritici IPO323]SMR63308.1 unnamed protein product [Zymoseptoria tritici ST99CH_1E4]SMR65233.1 unnamed protein product [Zymoseptoria tritici ST99CH_3D1]